MSPIVTTATSLNDDLNKTTAADVSGQRRRPQLTPQLPTPTRTTTTAAVANADRVDHDSNSW